MHRLAEKINEHLDTRAKHVLLVSHPRPDGDTLSAACAFMQYLKTINTQHLPFCTTPISAEFLFLPEAHKVTFDTNIFEEHEFDTICVFDTGDLKYAGIEEILEKLPYKPVIINFDHHLTNTNYGDYNFVIPTAASTTEVLYTYFNHIGVHIDEPTATCLLTGLITDTGNFSNQATTTESVGIAADLLRRGARFDTILNKTFRNKSVRGLHIWGTMLSRLTRNEEHDISYTYVTREDLREAQVGDEEIDGLSNFLNSLGEGKAILVMREMEDGSVKGSMRTTHDDVDVSAWAVKLGGGGHKKAAGFTIANARIATSDDAWNLFAPALTDTTTSENGQSAVE